MLKNFRAHAAEPCIRITAGGTAREPLNISDLKNSPDPFVCTLDFWPEQGYTKTNFTLENAWKRRVRRNQPAESPGSWKGAVCALRNMALERRAERKFPLGRVGFAR